MAVVTRSRRAAIQREAAQIRRDGQRRGQRTQRIAATIRRELPEVSALEAWRLALGWSRAEAIEQIARCYRADGLHPPGPTESMLCRWEHDPRDWPGPEYAVMIARAYGATLQDLDLTRHPAVCTLTQAAAVRYGRPDRAAPPPTWGEPMTTAAGLPAVRESLHLAMLADPGAGPDVLETAQAAVDHYALGYSKHPPHVLFGEVRAVRELLAAPLADNSRDDAELHRILGWLSALLGNLAYHLDDHTGARVHLATAARLGDRVGDARLVAWSYGAQSMVARARHQPAAAVVFAERGRAAAPTPLARAQLLGWALLPSLAAQGRAEDAENARRAADEALATASGDEPGRFGYDFAEHQLHQAEAYLALGQPERAAPLAETSADACTTGTPGWAAATLLYARAEAVGQPADAAARALDVLERVPVNRLRATSRARLAALDEDLTGVHTGPVSDLRDRLRALPAPIDPHGRPAPADQS